MSIFLAGRLVIEVSLRGLMEMFDESEIVKEDRIEFIDEFCEVYSLLGVYLKHAYQQVVKLRRVSSSDLVEVQFQDLFVEGEMVVRVLSKNFEIGVEEAHFKGNQSHAEHFYFLSCGFGLFPSQPKFQEPFWTDELNVFLFFFLFECVLQSGLVVCIEQKYFPIDKQVLSFCIQHNCFGSYCSVTNLVVLQEVQCSHDMVDHSYYLDLLEKEIGDLSLGRGQSIDLRIVAQSHCLCGLDGVAAHFGPGFGE